MKKLLAFLLIPLMLIACNEPKEVENTFTDIGDDSVTIERVQKIVYDNGERVEIHYWGGTLEHGTYRKFDAQGKVIEEGKYINGGFRERYDESNVRVEGLLAMILFALMIFSIWLFFKYRQAVIDWYRRRKRSRISD